MGCPGSRVYNQTMRRPVTEKQIQRVLGMVRDLFVTDAYYVHGSKLALSLRYRFEPARSLELLRDRLELSGYEFELSESEDLVLVTLDPRRKLKIPKLNIILFFVTLLTVYTIPVAVNEGLLGGLDRSFSGVLAATLEQLQAGRGLVFTVALMSILLVHEMGHFLASRRRNIVTSWPFFIPAPNFIGTFGAIIKSKSPFWNRRDLIEVGAAGPVAGWIVALAWLAYGIAQSQVFTIDQAPVDRMRLGDPLVFGWMVTLIKGELASNQILMAGEAATAAWVGLLVTAINLLPIGQLDGGHVLYGLTREKQHLLGWIAMVILFGLGFQSPLWWVFAAMGLIFKVPHPPTIDDTRRPSRASIVLGIFAIVIFVLSFTPAPFQ